MKWISKISLALLIFLIAWGLKNGISDEASGFEPLSSAGIHLEFNATDGDLEAVIEAVGADVGLIKLSVTAPDGRLIAQLEAPDASTLGIRSYRLESPEPKEVNLVKSAYPEGDYTLAGQTSDGRKLQGTAALSHRLSKMGSFLQPAAGASDLSINGLKITWKLDENAALYIIELEQEGGDASVLARLPGSVDAFAVPEGFLEPDSEYKVSIGVVNGKGNITFSETTFTTAVKR